MKTVLSIAGSDSSGGAGIQADIKTMTVNGVYAATAITAVTAQNTLGVDKIIPIDGDGLARQIAAVFEDIPPDAVKIGMLPNPESIRVTAKQLKKYGAKHVVLDPVLVATSGSKLAGDDGVSVLLRELAPIAEVMTPNLSEGEALSGMKIENKDDMVRAGKALEEKGRCAVLLKGGHREEDADDLLCSGGEITWFSGERIDNPNTHGTGCTLSSAIASYLAKGASLKEAVAGAKEYITRILHSDLNLGKGPGPLDHSYILRE